jgi:hypothetical protein
MEVMGMKRRPKKSVNHAEACQLNNYKMEVRE